MELTRENFRAMIFYDFCQGLTGEQCVLRMKETFESDSPSKTTIYRWFQEFRLNRESLCDEKRGGRPAKTVIPANIDAVRELITSERNVTCRELSETLNIDLKQISTILHEHLKVRKVCSRWIPHLLTVLQKEVRVKWCRDMLKRYHSGNSTAVYNIVTGDETWIYSYEPETKQQSTVWVFEDESSPTKVVRSRSVSKKMIAAFFGIKGLIAIVPLEDRKTVNSDWYTSICLPIVIAEVRKNNPKRDIVLHHDNASAHTAKNTNDYLEAKNIKLMSHCPYSPDLAPNDFFLFPKIKKIMRGRRFTCPNEAVEGFKSLVLDLSPLDWKNCMKDWFARMEKCINVNGEYFEKM